MSHHHRIRGLASARLAAMITAGALFAACAHQPEEKGAAAYQQQIAEAERAGTLEQLYASWAAEADKKGSGEAGAEARARLAELGKRLAARQAEAVRAELNAARLKDSGLVSLGVFPRLEEKSARLHDWDPARHQELARELASERARSQAALDVIRTTLKSLPETELQTHYRLLTDAATIAGAESEAGREFTKRRDQAVQATYHAGRQALEAQRFDEAAVLFARIAEVAPDFADVKRQAILTRIRQFQHLVANNRDDTGMDQAMRLYHSLSQRPDFIELKPALEPSVVAMLQHLIATGGAAAAKGQLADAYRWLKRAQDLRRLSGAPQDYSEEEKRFAAQVFALAEAAGQHNQPGLALGYLFVAQDIYPDLPSLKRQLRETQERTLDRATKRIAAASFTDGRDDGRLGGAVASKITQHLFHALPDDLRIVEREQLQAVKREQELVARPEAAAPALSSADYLIQGVILEADVATSEQKGHKVVRAVTRYDKVPNPDYQEWKKTDQRERKAPAEYLKEPVSEDIPLNIVMHRKVGVLGVSYRVVDVATARILFTDTLTRKKAESGESSDGVQLGDFSTPMKLAELPSDSEVMEALADEVASQIGHKLAQFLRDHEVKYEAAAKRHWSEGNPGAAAEELANAWALSTKKGKTVTVLSRELRRMALLARPAG